jgi:hypothetical protein
VDALGYYWVEIVVYHAANGHPVGDPVGATADTLADDPGLDVGVRDPDLPKGFDEDIGFLARTEVVASEPPEPAHAEPAFVVDADPRPVVERVYLRRHDLSHPAGYLRASITSRPAGGSLGDAPKAGNRTTARRSSAISAFGIAEPVAGRPDSG